jgi:hypothetical protein
MGKMRCAYKICFENLKGEDHFGRPTQDGRIVLKWILK